VPDGVDSSNPEVQDKGADNKDSVLPSEKNYDKSQTTDMESSMQNDGDHQQTEDSKNAEFPSKYCTCCVY
jgi:hypothetical protein